MTNQKIRRMNNNNNKFWRKIEVLWKIIWSGCCGVWSYSIVDGLPVTLKPWSSTQYQFHHQFPEFQFLSRWSCWNSHWKSCLLWVFFSYIFQTIRVYLPLVAGRQPDGKRPLTYWLVTKKPLWGFKYKGQPDYKDPALSEIRPETRIRFRTP